MITDKLENLSLYTIIPEVAIDFVKDLQTDIDLGRYNIAGDVYANVEEYDTKKISLAKFESHKKYADIQILLSGEECIFYTDVYQLQISEEYDKNKDIMFFKNNVGKHDNVKLNGKNFVLLFPWEAHAPQVSVNNDSKKVKKVVIKIPIKDFTF